MKYLEELNRMVKEAAKAAQAKASELAKRGAPVTLYLYYRPATAKEYGKLVMVNDDEPHEDGYKLATGEGLRGNVPYANYETWIRDRVQRLPILAWEV